MQAMLTNPNYGIEPGQSILQYADYQIIGNLTFQQLAELRHRGAFSTVTQTFASCCSQCTKSKDAVVAELPKIWYKVCDSPAITQVPYTVELQDRCVHRYNILLKRIY